MTPRQIEDLEGELGRDWFRGVVDGLTQDDRELEGGWPGTLSDARRLLATRLGALSIAMTKTEIERSAKAIYRVAKGRWLEVANRFAATR